MSCSSSRSESPEGAILTDTLELDTIVAEEKEPEIDLTTTDKQLAFMKLSEDRERYEEGILPQMAKEVPEYCEKLLKSEFPRFIIVDKAKMKLFLYDKYGNIEKSYGIACARNYGTKHKKGDLRTSEGFFSAEGIYDSTDWLFTDDEGHTSQVKGQFGPRFIRLDIPNTRQIGIHGTIAPWSIGSRCSHGCIRMTNEHIMELVELAEVGMPIIVSPGPRDISVNESEGYLIAAVTTVPGGKRAIASKNQVLDINTEKIETSDSIELIEEDSSEPNEVSIEIITNEEEIRDI